MKRFAVASIAVAFAACGSSQTIVTQVAGTVSGRSFGAKDAVFNLGEWSNGFGQFYGTTTAVQISDYSGQCTYDTKGQQPPDSQTLTLVLSINAADGRASPASAVGDYPIQASDADASAPNARRADAWYDLGGRGSSGSYDCFKASFQSASSSGGKVTLTSVAADHLEGTFDVALSGGDRLTGSFTAPRCGSTCVPGASGCTGLNLNSSPTCP
jgi:hypothetical protein